MKPFYVVSFGVGGYVRFNLLVTFSSVLAAAAREEDFGNLVVADAMNQDEKHRHRHGNAIQLD